MHMCTVQPKTMLAILMLAMLNANLICAYAFPLSDQQCHPPLSERQLTASAVNLQKRFLQPPARYTLACILMPIQTWRHHSSTQASMRSRFPTCQSR